LTAGVLLAVFIYKDKTPGRAAVISTVVLLGTYAIVTTVAQAFAGIGDQGIGLSNPDNAGDVFAVVGGAVFGTSGFGSFMTHLLVLLVLTSAAASTQTTILPTARTTLSMAVSKAIPDSFARIHQRYLTRPCPRWPWAWPRSSSMSP
jgi:amino acid transporter